MKALVAVVGLAVTIAAPLAVAAEDGIDLSKIAWAESVKLNGDVRIRHQNDDDASKVGDRDRKRIRARVSIVGKPTEALEVGVGLASGSSDPVSTNQTIQGFGESKSINLDLAYFQLAADENTTISGGKFKNNLAAVGSSQLQWDGDWRPEGFGVNYEDGMFFTNALYTWLNGDDDQRDALPEDNVDDVTLAVGQVGINTKVGGAMVKVGVGYSTVNTKGKPCMLSDGCGQNSLNASPTLMTDVYSSDFNTVEAFVEAGLQVAEQPLKIWGHYITNTDADPVVAAGNKKLDSGFQFGAQIGKAKKKGTWQGKIYYQELDADATLAVLANSDFAGGGTDNKGIYIGGAYALSDKSTVGVSYFAAEDKNERSGSAAQDYDALQVDLQFKF